MHPRRHPSRHAPPTRPRTALRLLAAALLAPTLAPADSSADSPAPSPAPRIINLYNFIRNSDFRLANSEEILFDCTRRQIELLKQAKLPATWALQHDALVNPRYQQLLKQELGPDDEVGAWWEIPKSLTDKAGLPWRGSHDWDPAANVGFAPGYTPDERLRLVDAYMADFKEVFGRLPRTAGSWFIDEVTLAHMADRYHIVASCNCKDQIGTDFYTLWGGYWNQAYYPSRVNAYMPAQTPRGQLGVPVFRMLGSDPVYQHGTTPGLQSLEPVYSATGGSPAWVDWFMNNLAGQPCLAFAYAQAGQENSFGWQAMRDGLVYQVGLIARERAAGRIRVETLERTGVWFRARFPVTPATAVVALDDWKNEGRRTVWYDSRFYRANILWEGGGLFIRDLHRFDERVVSPTHTAPLVETSLVYETLPVVDWAQWSHAGVQAAGMWPVAPGADGAPAPLKAEGAPEVRELGPATLEVRQPLAGGATLTVTLGEKSITCTGTDAQRKPLAWAWRLRGGKPLEAIVHSVHPGGIRFQRGPTAWQVKVGPAGASCRLADDRSIELLPDRSGRLEIMLAE